MQARPGVRLRQVALVARDLEAAVGEARSAFGLGEPYRDPDVAIFGLENAVFAVGDCFLEIVSPVRDGTAAGRHLERLGGDGGYMAIFEVVDLAAARARVRGLGVRIAWEIELEGIAGMHLHPADVPGAIVSLDQPRPPGSWLWGGPDWRPAAGGIRSVTVEAPEGAADRWTEVLGEEPPGVRFAAGDRGIVEVTLEREGPEATYALCGVNVSTVNPAAPTVTR